MGSTQLFVRSLARLVVVISILLFVALSQTYAADTFKMGVMDPQSVLEKSKAGKKALDALKEYVTARQKLLSRDEADLQALEKTLKDQESGLSETTKKDKQAQFRTKVEDYQKRAQSFNQELQAKQKELVDDYMKKIGVVTQTIAEKNGFSIVLDKGSEQTLKIVIFNKDSIDLTEQVTKEFDRVHNK